MSEPFDVAVCGSLNTDLVARVAALPACGETVLAQSLARWPGGKGLNQAIAAARLGARTTMQGAVGNDPEGDVLRALLHDTGIHTHGVLANASRTTGLAQIWVASNGDNSIVVDPGANAELSAAEVAQHLPKAAVYLVQCEIPSPAAVAFLEGARERGGVRLLNLAPVPPDASRLLALADVVIVNERELETTLEQIGAGGSMPIAVAERAHRLLASPSQTVIVTLGAAGATVVTRTDSVHVPARKAPVVDTTGAGDAFCGALAAELAAGQGLASAVRNATLAASIVVGRAGAAPAMPTLAELAALSAS